MKYDGFSILEFMIALVTSSILFTSVLSLYLKTHKAYIKNNKQLMSHHDLRLVAQIIANDVRLAGIFGSFSFHKQSFGQYKVSKSNQALCSNTTFCEFMTDTIGISSSKLDVDGITSGVSSYANSDLLKIQFGGRQSAHLIPYNIKKSCHLHGGCMVEKCSLDNNFYLNNLYFTSSSFESSASLYMLSSANRAYLLQFNKQNIFKTYQGMLNLDLANNGCPRYGDVAAQLVSAIKDSNSHYDSLDPDIHTMILNTFNTVYYFVGDTEATESGLYVTRLQNNGQMSTPRLVSSKILSMKISYLLNINGKFLMCNTEDMISGNGSCNGNWNRITAANITLYTHDDTYITETISW